MPKTKYRLNPETLQYELYTRTRKSKVWRGILFVTLALITGMTFRFGYGEWYVSLKEQKLEQRQEQLQKDMLKLNSEISKNSSELSLIQTRDDIFYRAVLGQNPIPESHRKAGVGGTEKYSSLQGFENSSLMVSTQRSLDELSRQLVVQSRSFDDVTERAIENDKYFSSKPMVQPMNKRDIYRISDKFGWRIDPFTGKRKTHHGVDYAGLQGKPIYTTGDGKVVFAGVNGAYGKVVVVDHGFGYKTKYAHLHEIKVKKGDVMKRGELVGTLGSTGRSTGPHLHYEVVKNNRRVDPLDYYIEINEKEFDAMVSNAATQE